MRTLPMLKRVESYYQFTFFANCMRIRRDFRRPLFKLERADRWLVVNSGDLLTVLS